MGRCKPGGHEDRTSETYRHQQTAHPGMPPRDDSEHDGNTNQSCSGGNNEDKVGRKQQYDDAKRNGYFPFPLFQTVQSGRNERYEASAELLTLIDIVSHGNAIVLAATATRLQRPARLDRDDPRVDHQQRTRQKERPKNPHAALGQLKIIKKERKRHELYDTPYPAG